LTGTNGYSAPGWSFQDFAVRRDGQLQVLLTQTNRTAQVWTLTSAGTLQSTATHVSSNGWTPFKMVVAPNNTPALVWTNTGGRVSVWPLTTTGAKQTTVEFNKGDRWRLEDAQVNAALGKRHLFWQTLDGTNIVWTLSNLWNLESGVRYNPNAAISLLQWGPGTDGNLHLLWERTNGWATVWTTSSAGSFLAGVHHTPPSNATCLGLGMLPSGRLALGWEHPTDLVELWRLSSTGAKEKGCPPFSPGSDWKLTLVTVDAAGKLHLLWQAEDGRVRLQRYWFYNCSVECEAEYAPPTQ